VKFVEVVLDGWDTHQDNFGKIKALAATLDPALSALLDDLAARGLLGSTLVTHQTGPQGRVVRRLLPAMERVYPALTSQFVLLMLASSIMSSIGAEELFGIANRIQSDTFRNFEIFIVLWVAYLVLSYLMRAGFWLLGQIVFTRRRKLGTPL